jgi:hypothetical protein
MTNGKQYIEQPHTPTGKQFLIALRKSDARFKHQRITSVLQLSPSLVEIGVIHQMYMQ